MCLLSSFYIDIINYYYFQNLSQMSLQSSTESLEEPQPQRRSRSPIRSTHNGPSLLRTQSLPPPSSHSDVVVDFSNIRYEIIAGKRLYSKMLHAIDEQQMYRFRINHKAQYNCNVNKCPSKVYVDLTTHVCARKTCYEPHNHGPNDQIDKIQLNDSIKKRCRSAAVAARSGGNLREIFHNTVRE